MLGLVPHGVSSQRDAMLSLFRVHLRIQHGMYSTVVFRLRILFFSLACTCLFAMASIEDFGWMRMFVEWELDDLVICKYHHHGQKPKRSHEYLMLRCHANFNSGHVGFLRMT